MKIQFQVKDKEVVFPEFELANTDEDNHLVLMIKKIPKEEISVFNSHFEHNTRDINMESGVLFVKTDKVYGFDLNDFPSPQNDFYLGFAFCDENDKIYDKPVYYIYLSCE